MPNTELIENLRQEVVIDLGRLLSDQPDQIAWGTCTPEKWSWMEEVALAHGVAPLLSRKLHDLDGAKYPVPDKLRSDLEQAYYRTVAANQLFSQELDRVLTALAKAGVQVVVLKGADLATSLYGDIGLRPMNDLDLWVAERDLGQATRVLQSLGYHWQKSTYHLVFSGPHGVAVEVHWQLIYPRLKTSFNPDQWLLQHTLAYPGLDVPGVLTLEPLANLLYLVAHLEANHNYDGGLRLIWLQDIHRLVTAYDAALQWDELIRVAERAGLRPTLEEVLYWAHQFYGTSCDERLADGRPENWPSPVWGARRQVNPDASGRIWGSLRALAPRQRARVALGLIFPDSTYVKSRYPQRWEWLWPLGYLQRAIELISIGVPVLVARKKE